MFGISFIKLYPLGYLVVAEDGKTLKCRQPKGNNSAIPDDTEIKLHMHNFAMVLYVRYKFHKVISIGLPSCS